jgi:hypothetical protein
LFKRLTDMNNDVFINQLAYLTGCPRKQVIDTLRRMSAMPEVQKFIKEQKHGKGRGERAS